MNGGKPPIRRAATGHPAHHGAAGDGHQVGAATQQERGEEPVGRPGSGSRCPPASETSGPPPADGARGPGGEVTAEWRQGEDATRAALAHHLDAPVTARGAQVAGAEGDHLAHPEPAEGQQGDQCVVAPRACSAARSKDAGLVAVKAEAGAVGETETGRNRGRLHGQGPPRPVCGLDSDQPPGRGRGDRPHRSLHSRPHGVLTAALDAGAGAAGHRHEAGRSWRSEPAPAHPAETDRSGSSRWPGPVRR